jgi:FkbM family methyltransferase
MESFLRFFSPERGKTSFAQCGEDLIVDFIFSALKLPNPSYLDIGAHHPIYLNNTFFFYQKGCSGVCVEPDPALFAKIKSKRKRDICLNVGVGGTHESKADFYIMRSRTLNTFSKEEAVRYQSRGRQKIKKVIQTQLVPINEILNKYFISYPNFISLDVEGMELGILKTFDFSKFRPEVFCIETLTYTEDKSEQKITDIIKFMISKGYFAYADTYINTIFVDKKSWDNRKL